MKHRFRAAFLFAFVCAVTIAAEKDAEVISTLGEPNFQRQRAEDAALQRGVGVVRWRNWGEDALNDAARSNKPILLFITGNWCRFGHTMERVTFTDLEIATRLNEEFIPVRLNRDDRPDIDVRMQQVIQSLTGNRGWPATIWMTPEGKPFFGSTFLSSDEDAAAGRVGMRSLINDIIWSWKGDKDLVKRQAAELEAELRKTVASAGLLAELPEDFVKNTAASVIAKLNSKTKGGRFPAPRELDLLLNSEDKPARERALKTLDEMLRGGIYDQIDGGFHRCSIDSEWKIPRFEKLLSVNAEMLPVLLHAWKLSGEAKYKASLEQTVNLWMGLRDDSKTFFALSQAGGTADFDDGDYFTWTISEIENLFRDETDCRLAELFFDINEQGDLPGSSPDRNVLFEVMRLEDAAKNLNIKLADAAERLDKIRRTLRQARLHRTSPRIERTVYIDVNALMAAALIECGRGLGCKDIETQGLKTLNALIESVNKQIKRNGNLAGSPHLVLKNESSPNVIFSQDEAALAYACAQAFEVTGDKPYLDEAESSLRRLFQNFWDKTDGGYFDRTDPQGPEAQCANWKLKSYQDTSEASTNALAALASARLARVTGRQDFEIRARTIVEAFAQSYEKLGGYASGLAEAIQALQQKKKK